MKGETSGAIQELVAVAVDCDRDALRFTVHQAEGFCHLGTRSCWGPDLGLHRLARRLAEMADHAPPGSNTVRLLEDPVLLRAKLVEEARELAEATDRAHVVEEAADLLYFAMVKAVSSGVDLAQIEQVLDRRERTVTRRHMTAREER